MAVLEMQRIGICANKKNRKQILELLQRRGVVEIDTDVAEDEVFQKTDTSSARAIFEKNAQLAEGALDILQKYVPENKGMFASLAGKDLIDESDYRRVVDSQDEVMSKARKLNALSRQVAENKANIQKRENQYEALEPWKTLGVPMNFTGTKETYALLGTMPEVLDTAGLCSRITECLPELESFHAEVVSSDRDQTYVIILVRRRDGELVEEKLRALGFARPSQIGSLTPAARQEQLLLKKAALEEENVKLEEEIKTYEGCRNDLKIAADYYRARIDKYEVLGGLLQSKNTFIVTGYVPARDAGNLEKELTEQFVLAVDISPVDPDDEPPVALKNNKYSSAYEGIVESFGLPGKGEIDPTAIMSWCYVFFFGMMLSDAAYGLLISVVCFIMLKKYPRMSKGMNKSLHMFMYCGLSTIFWGVMFGGYFGDVVTVVASTFFGVDIEIPALWFAPLDDPMKLVIYSLLFGLIHMFLGLAIKAYTYIRQKKYFDAFVEVGLWYIFLLGLIFIFLPTSMFESISQMHFEFPAIVNTISLVAIIVGAVGIVLFSEYKRKSWPKRILMGLYGLYDVTSWLSDTLSYSRLMALGLATGVIASVVNSMGSMFGGGIFGAILFIAIFLVGHSLNLGINLLGAYVHTNRLQYVEFFGKFYEGGGRAFAPFHMETKYVDINSKEEN